MKIVKLAEINVNCETKSRVLLLPSVTKVVIKVPTVVGASKVKQTKEENLVMLSSRIF